MCVVVNLGFAKDAKDHIDIQGFNVYHKNRLIKVVLKLLLYLRYILFFLHISLTKFPFSVCEQFKEEVRM